MGSARIGKKDVLSGRPVSRPLQRTHPVMRLIASRYGILLVFPTIVFALGAFLTSSAQRALRGSNLEMASQRMGEQATLVTQHLRAALDQGEPMLDTLSEFAASVDSAAPIEPVATLLRDLLHGRPGVSFVSISFADGTFEGAFLNDAGEARFQVSRLDGAVTQRDEFAYGQRGQLRLVGQTVTNYDPRKRSFYHLAQREAERVWTKPYPFFSTNYTGITRTQPVYRPDDSGRQRLHAVLTVDFDVHRLSQLLAKSELPEVHTLLFSGDGALLAYPEGAERIAALPSREDRVLHYSDLGDPLLEGFFAALPRGSTESSEPRWFESGGQRYLAAVSRVNDDRMLDWNVAYLVPERVFLSSLNAYSKSSLVVAALALLVAFGISVVFARLVVRVRREAAEARAEAKRVAEKARELGSYRLVECLGKGGMGEVWRAEHRLLAREAAIKLIRNDEQDDISIDAQERFRREAQSLASLRSRNTIELFDYGVAEDGTFFYVMELLDGLDLESLVSRHGPQPPARVIHLLVQACRSLTEAHAAGLVHRDVKPANLFVCRIADELDVVKVLDFGLVRSVGSENVPMPPSLLMASPFEGSGKLTHANNVMGTPDFMAPEQALGHEVDGRADLYALGCVAFWLLTGRPPFLEQNTLQLLVAHITQAAPRVETLVDDVLPPGLAELIHECLDKSPEHRPQSARELLTRLLAVELPPAERWTEERARSWWEVRRVPKPRERVSPTSETLLAART